MIKKIVIIGVIVLVTIAVVNDAGRYVITWFNLDEVTRETSKVAATAASQGRDSAATAAVDYAATQDVVVYAYDQDDDMVHVWTRTDLQNTWFLGTVLIFIQGGELADSYQLQAEHSRSRS